MYRYGVIAAIVGVSLAASAAAQPADKPPPKITIAYDTTRITTPLKPDGTPDYLAALNRTCSRGVTSSNNAAVLLLYGLGPSVIHKDIRPAFFKKLGVALPAERKYFKRFPRSWEAKNYKAALEGPWRSKDHPSVSTWLRRNIDGLTGVLSASRRDRYYMPLVMIKADGTLVSVLSPPAEISAAAEALIIRANLALGKGRARSVWQDIMAVHRLGMLQGQDARLMAHLAGCRLSKLASEATVHLAASGKLSAKQARKHLQELRMLGPVPQVEPAIDRLERYVQLDSMIHISRNPREFLAKSVQVQELLASLTARKSENLVKSGPAVAKLSEKADWNVVLRRVNVYFDTVLAAMRKPTYAERRKARERITARLKKLKRMADSPDLDKPVGKESVATRRTGTVLLAMLLPDLPVAQELADAAAVRRDVAMLSLALAAHKAEKGSYPQALRALAPTYLRTVPNDFCSGRPFIYKRAGEGYLLYGVGQNAKDDGGVFDREKDKDDIVAKADK